MFEPGLSLFLYVSHEVVGCGLGGVKRGVPKEGSLSPYSPARCITCKIR